MRLLIVDDEPSLRRMLRLLLAGRGHQVSEAGTLADAAAAVRAAAPDVILLDVQLPDGSGLEALPVLRAEAPAARVLMMTAHGSIPSAVQAMRHGAFDYLTKPFDNEELLARLGQVQEIKLLREEVDALREELAARYGLSEMVGAGPRMGEVFKTVRKVAPTAAPVLVVGESGSGKELVARAIHRLSPRAGGPFVAVNCGAIPAGLVEDAFFGHVRGAFTNAVAERPGHFAAAKGGTLFLDEIGELPLEAQVVLLRVLQEKTFTPVGGNRPEATDVRVLAATNVDLEQAVAAGRFRQDLFWRLNVVTIRVPPLRERGEDIPALADTLLAKWSKELQIAPKRLEPLALAALARHDWPGNVRELENTLYRALVMAEGDVIGLADLPARVRGGAGAETEGAPAGENGLRTLDELMTEVRTRFEAAEIRERLRACGFSRTRTAASLGISRKTLFNKMREFGIAGAEDDAAP